MSSLFERLEKLADFLGIGGSEPVPNKLTIGMGKLVREAREEAGLSQLELAKMVYRRRATISAIETGKSEATVSTLVLISAALEKPLTYFMPWFIYYHLEDEKFTPLEEEMLLDFQKIYGDDHKELALRLVKEIVKVSENLGREDSDRVKRILGGEETD